MEAQNKDFGTVFCRRTLIITRSLVSSGTGRRGLSILGSWTHKSQEIIRWHFLTCTVCFLETLNTWNISEMLIRKMTMNLWQQSSWHVSIPKPQTNLNYFNFKLAFSLQCNKHFWCYLSARFIAIYLSHLIGSQKGRIWSQKTSCRSEQTFQEKSTKVRSSGVLSVITWFVNSAYLSSPS